ncbi:hypothetical protein O6H91_02G079400 [Diphasiastrum complanatum]|uniref:Uncharacterized protein n=1 Tax=Diphasiastrum complanatum TaxID=34168 RepID=A0ACC2EH38_DIPCM|nr:hypothetical protein O6H91_Y288900 [Diphasiastrum complanatum]KAJ7565889.1 hypothetical protein O6H91_02G079400 [Diphasiastrum complanatum]
MDLTVAHDKRFCNLIEFFWPLEGKTINDVHDAVVNAYGLLGAGFAYLNTSALIKSLDGSSIGCYELWRKDTDFDELSATVLAPVVESLKAVASYDFYLTDIIAGGSKSGAPQVFSTGKIYYIAEFPLDPDYQDVFFSDIKAFFDKQLLELAEFISYTISKATDHSRIVIIEEWDSVAAARKLALALTNLPHSPLKDRNPSKSSNTFENLYIYHSAQTPAQEDDLQSSSALTSNSE